MIEAIFYFVHYALLLLLGVFMSAVYAGVQIERKANIAVISAMFALCASLQLGALLLLGEEKVWELYPLITHIPIMLMLWLYYKKRIATAVVSVTAAYLCCQPAKWVGLITGLLTGSYIAEQSVRILMLLGVGGISVCYLATYLSQIFQKDTRSVCIFGSIPVVYYLYDYITSVYTDLWETSSHVVTEFLPFFLCIVFLLFCIVYYKEYEQKADAEHKEHIIRITAQQQESQVESVKRREQEIRMIRHDMRLFLSSLLVSIDNGTREETREMVTSFTSYVDRTKLEVFCENNTVNCVLSDFAAKCKARNVSFTHNVAIEGVKVDELLFASILSNALDNALNAQEKLPEGKRRIKLMLKTADGRLLLSVKNPVETAPVFADGLPVTKRDGHGYGTQSIRYTTERLGGNCQFSMQDGWFVVRVML